MGLVNSWASEAYNVQGIEIVKTVETLRDWGIAEWQNIVVKSTIGYHPWSCENGEITEENIQQKMVDLKKLYTDNKEYIVAIGECGIDTYYPWTEEFELLNRWSVELWWKLFIGFCGNVTYKNAHNLRDSLAKIPLAQLLLETDAPRLSPQVVRGETNHPANVKYIYEFVAEFLNIDSEVLSDHIEKNFKAVYSL